MEYEIKAGDTLWDLSKIYGIPVEELAKMNGIRDPNKIRAGAKIFIPGQGPNKASVMYNSGRSAPKPVQARQEMSSWDGRTGTDPRHRTRAGMELALMEPLLAGVSPVGVDRRAAPVARSMHRVEPDLGLSGLYREATTLRPNPNRGMNPNINWQGMQQMNPTLDQLYGMFGRR